MVLVGAGPGDAGLLTLKGLQQIQQADVVVYDRLVSDDIMNLVRRDADRVFVGKRGIPLRTAGRDKPDPAAGSAKRQTLVRLKGGDPFILAVVAKSWKHCATRVFRSRWFRVLPQLLVALPIRVFRSRIAIMPRACA
ncbi:siroheme synthase [includes: uroporphyrinogen-III C-methyltransferase; precorrin-2 dehydrogenase;sirohydrochlorin ferrochelatase] [Escherichia coli]|uniref:Siroheme synthase [includes: uroporphyrinogen-III C-methyltransferase precorrin-2 dehydrogenasesirohydrochlorin ferrochelatase] n=1 Tax=Escherichia coli TaxID=562 RepID=A0A376MLA4_ECOLX|nr:siroheme synthase [includes: uroporphyrinogen-III C-methyltransferase; precorrin-2 dehydrogenase;sirohydrochlorin ferrochelatase] [Escherichia coli]